MAAPDKIQFVVTPRIERACASLAAAFPESAAGRADFARISEIGAGKRGNVAAVISLADIKALSQGLREHGSDSAWIHQLLRGSRIYIEQPVPKPRNPELVARLEKIKRQLEDREYGRMVAGIAHPGPPTDAAGLGGGDGSGPLPAVPGVRAGQAAACTSIKHELRDVNQTVSVIINILFSALGVGFAVGYASYTLTSEIGWRVLMALGAAAAIVLAESWLYMMSGTRGQKQRLQRTPRVQVSGGG